MDESDWTDEVHDTVPDAIKTRWNEAISFVMNSTDDEFVSGIGNYFDIDSLVDYYIFGVLICNMDGFGKNQLYMTYDGQKWYATVYDLDSTFGTYFSTILSTDYARNQFEDFNTSADSNRAGNLLYIRIAELFIPEIQNRWDELREGALSLTNIINRFERFTDITPAELVKEDYAETTADGAFTAIPLQTDSNIQQIRNFIAARYDYVNNYIKALGSEHTLLYYLPEETTFDGVDDYIDTGLAVMDEARSFTIVVDYTEAENVAKGGRVFSCVQDHGGGSYGGLTLMKYLYGDNGYFVGGFPGNGEGFLFTSPFNSNYADGRTKIAFVFEDGVPLRMTILDSSGNQYDRNLNAAVIEKYPFIHARNIFLGCREYGSMYENKGNFWAGTIHAFEVWDYAMTAEEVTEKLE